MVCAFPKQSIRLINITKGMFLFAKLVLTNLFAQITLEQLYEELRPETFPKGFEQAYVGIHHSEIV